MKKTKTERKKKHRKQTQENDLGKKARERKKK